MEESSAKQLVCPTCGKALLWDKDNSFRPFCSERCKLIDLGNWASDSYVIAGEPVGGEEGRTAEEDDA